MTPASRCIVATVSIAGKFPNLGLEKHFSHVFIDEAGTCTEPEALATFATLTTKNPSIVLAGDPKQLGPVIRSPLAEKFGLGMSLIERLLQRAAYSREKGTYNRLFVTKLIRNYRSHPAILKVPNTLFYDNDLLPFADPTKSHALANWAGLPKRGFPCIFHGVEGVENREGVSIVMMSCKQVVHILFIDILHYVLLIMYHC
jgi:hypothetical protein